MLIALDFDIWFYFNEISHLDILNADRARLLVDMVTPRCLEAARWSNITGAMHFCFDLIHVLSWIPRHDRRSRIRLVAMSVLWCSSLVVQARSVSSWRTIYIQPSARRYVNCLPRNINKETCQRFGYLTVALRVYI